MEKQKPAEQPECSSGATGRNRAAEGIKQAGEALYHEKQQIVAMFDSMAEVIYVADPQTYELLYLNKPACEIWGDRLGEPCYRVLQGRDAPCPFCTNDRIFGDNTGRTYIREFKNMLNQRWYRCTDRAIRWSDGRMVRFEMAVDIHDSKEAQEKLKRHVNALEETNRRLEILMSGISGRENRMVLLKQEVNDLLEAAGSGPKYRAPLDVEQQGLAPLPGEDNQEGV